MSRRVVAVCVVVLSSTLAAVPARGQAVRATVLGTITDHTGAVLPGAMATITNDDTGVAHVTVSDSQGHYTLTNLLPDPYDIEASLSGFQTMSAVVYGWLLAARVWWISRLPTPDPRA